jgi:hypothetical protein
MRKPSSKVIALSNAFSAIIREWVPDKVFEINQRNKEPYYIDNGLCATHDFCDPNQAIINAFKQVYDKEPSVQNEQHNLLIIRAWNLSKSIGFNTYVA